MERYKEYKDSGVKWLGKIPSHWEVKHLRNFLTMFSEKGFGDSQLLSVTREKGVILRDKENKEENHNYVPDDLNGYKHLNVGDFVINKMKSWQGSYGVSDYEGIVSPAYFTCKLHGVMPSFFSRAIRSKAYIGFFMQYSKGIRVDQWDLDPSSMKDIPFILPSEKEQLAIASYLDSVTSKIDRAIAQQQRMIELLNERKQIIINNAVTKGLDPNVPMKDSGVEWIGMIPEHWEVRKLKSIVSKVGSGITPRGGGSVYVDEGIMLLRSQNVYFEGFKLNDVAFITESMDRDMSNTRVHEGDVLINITGGSIGRCCYVPKGFPRANVNQHVCIIRPLKFSTLYLYYLLRSNCCQLQVDLQQTGGNREGLTSAALKNFILPVPSVKEQKRIIQYLDNKIMKLQSLIEVCTRQISLLQERKQIIINDVVTGKVKVV